MNPGMRMYMMTQGDNGSSQNRRMEYGSRMAKEDGKYQERGIGQDEQGYMLPYREPRPEFGETEMRYRGEDGRYKSGTRRNEMGGREHRWEFTVKPKNEYSKDMPTRNHVDPDRQYMPMNTYARNMESDEDYDDPSGRVIGFQRPRNHFIGKNEYRHDMEKGMHSMDEEEFSREDAREWVDGMINEDDKKPHGGMWDENFVKPLAQRVGVPSDGSAFWEFYAVVNALHSDLCKVLAEYNADHPMCYAKLAKAWIHDKDAVDNKTKMYWECIVKPKMYERKWAEKT